ncbi:alpha/beta fold hydrolase [Brackiella oedipodis]|uniref:alpha/beta fold hydrolase n=1 Tax=Brackiella oedipodis TaxID=124225 RepID=UPI00048FA06C|nr:alpha/beta hydrolase [Brackiella oedipodis]
MQFEPETKTFEFNGLNVTYHSLTRPEHTRNPVVLVHGTGGTLKTHFYYVFNMLSVHQDVYGIDLATPEGDDPMELNDWSDQVIHLIQNELKLKNVTLVGYSLGAVVVCDVAARIPESIDKLVPLAGWAKTENDHRLRAVAFDTVTKMGGAEAMDHMRTLFFLSDKAIAAMPLEDSMAIGARLRENHTPGFGKQAELTTRIDILDQLLKIKAETLVVGCTFDRLIPVKHSHMLYGAIEGARLAILDTGHALMVEMPARVVQLINNFNQDSNIYPRDQVIENYSV